MYLNTLHYNLALFGVTFCCAELC